MHSSNFLDKERRRTYLRYARIGGLVMNHNELPLYVRKLVAEKESRASLGVTHLDDF